MRYLKHLKYCMICAALFLCMSFTCTDEVDLRDNKIVFFINNSDESIYVGDSSQDELFTTEYALRHGIDFLTEINPGEIATFYNRIPDNILSAKDKTQYIVFTESTFQKYSIEDIKDNDIYDAYYSFDYNELEKINFKIFYPNDK